MGPTAGSGTAMEPTADQVRVLAGALTQLRTATAPTARIQAVRTATQAVQGLAVEDRQVLVERLLAHGAPAAAGAVSRHLGDPEVPAAARTAIAQELLGLAPVEVARITEELLAETASAHAPARPVAGPDLAWEPPTSPPDPALPPPGPLGPVELLDSRADEATRTPVASGAREVPAGQARSGPPPPPREVRRRSDPTTRAHAPPTPRRAVPANVKRTPAPRRRAAPDDRWTRLAGRLAEADDGRERRDLLIALEVPVPAERLGQLLDAVPAGWQRRMALRHLATGGRLTGAVTDEVLSAFDREGDRFAAAALLTRSGHAKVDALAVGLPDGLADRLRRRRTTVP